MTAGSGTCHVARMIPVASKLSDVAAPYSVLLCDVWGVVHNGVAPFPVAVDALVRARGAGKKVVLVSNAPRPSGEIPAQLARLGVTDKAYDLIVTSGDAAREILAQWSAAGEVRLHHIGPARDLPLYEGLAVARAALGEASHVVCTGPFDDDTETPDDYAETLAEIARRRLPFLCANPDIVVQRGDRLIYCAGALAQKLEALGGAAIYPGKPHAPIYELALKRLAEKAGRAFAKTEILAIGDGLMTDILGAERFAIAALFIAGGIDAACFVKGGGVDAAAVAAACRSAGVRPLAAMRALED